MKLSELVEHCSQEYFKRFGVEPTHAHVFPEVFGSTAGPFGGIGGQLMTTFQCCVVLEMDTVGSAMVFYGGRLKWVVPKIDGPFIESLAVGFLGKKQVYCLKRKDRLEKDGKP